MKKTKKHQNIIIGQLLYYQIFQKYMRDLFSSKCLNIKPFFSKIQCNFTKGFSAQQRLLSMLQKWKSALDNQKNLGALLTNLSKAFDCLSDDFLIANIMYTVSVFTNAGLTLNDLYDTTCMIQLI